MRTLTQRLVTLGIVALVVMSVGVSGVAVADTDTQPSTAPGAEAEETQVSDDDNTTPDSDSHPVTTAITTSNIDLTVSIGSAQPYGGGSKTLQIWVGATNTSTQIPTGVANVPITVEIETPNGEVLTRNVTTGPLGSANLSLTPSQNGAYRVMASSPATPEEGYGEVYVGTKTYAFPGWHSAVEVGHPVSIGVAAFNHSQPAGNTVQQFTFETPTSRKTTNITTNTRGIGTYRFTPSQAGGYSVSPSQGEHGADVEAGDVTAKQSFNTPWSDNLYFNQTAAIYGQVKDEGAGYANQEIIVTIHNDNTASVVTNLTTTTSSTGQFIATWTPPTNETDYQVSLHTPGGDTVATSSYEIEVYERPDRTTSPSYLDLRLDYRNESWDPQLAPGESATVDISVYANGTPVSGAQVNLSGIIGWPGAVLTSGSVTTNSSGIATYEFTVPSTAPDQASFELQAIARVNGQAVTETSYADLSYVAFNADSEIKRSNGEPTFTYTIEATDAMTGAPVANVPSLVFLEKSPFNATIIDSAAVTTNTSGVGTVTMDIGGVSGEVMVSAVGPFQRATSYTSVFASTYDVDTTNLADQYTPGDKVSFTYSATTGAPVSANVIVAAGDDDAAQAETGLLYANQVQEGEQINFTIPKNTSVGLDYDVTIIASTADGQRSRYSADFNIVESTGSTNTPPKAQFTVSPSSPTVNESVTFNASMSYDPDGSVASYLWDFDNDGDVDARGVTATHTYTTSGNYSAVLLVTDDAGAHAQTQREIQVSAQTQSVVGKYDQDGNGIEVTELLRGISDFRSNSLSVTDLLKLITNWRS